MPTRGYTHPSGTTSQYDPTLSTSYLSGLWRNCPLAEFRHDPSVGVLLDECFVSYDATATTGDYLLTQATTGSAAISTTTPGTLSIDSGATTSGQGANVQRLKSAFIPAANKSIWAEFRVSGTTSVTGNYFIGLAASDTTIVAANAQTTNNRIGWGSFTNDGVLLFDADKAGTSLTAIAATTLSTSVVHKLGFFYDGVADTIQQYVDDVATGSAVPTANIPKVVIYPSFVCQTRGTTQPVLNIHGYRIFQLR